jgi:glycerate 2-kinase
MTNRRLLLRQVFDVAVAAAHPDVVLERHLRPAPRGKVICLSAGKGAAAMAAAAERHYLEEDDAALVVAPLSHGAGVHQLTQVARGAVWRARAHDRRSRDHP